MKAASILQAVAVGLAILASPAQSESPDERTETELRRMTQELLDAIAPGEIATWERYVDQRLVHMDENGVVRNKEELLKEIQPLPAGLVGRIEIDKFKGRSTATPPSPPTRFRNTSTTTARRCGAVFGLSTCGCRLLAAGGSSQSISRPC